MMNEQTYPLEHYLKKVDALHLYDVRRAWVRAGFPADEFGEESYPITAERYLRFWQRLEEEPTFTENVAAVARHAATSPLTTRVQPLICSASLEAAVDVAAKAFHYSAPARVEPDWRGDEFFILVDPAREFGELPQMMLQFFCVFFVEVHRTCTITSHSPKRIQMPKGNKDWTAIEEAVGAPIEHNNAPAIIYDLEVARIPFLTRNDAALDGLLSSLKLEQVASTGAKSLKKQVRRELIANLADGAGDIDVICQKLNLSRRTLQRRLDEEETGFKEILTDVRKELAIQLLASSNINIAEISHQLGYGNPATFARAFKSWFGTSPKDYRTENGN